MADGATLIGPTQQIHLKTKCRVDKQSAIDHHQIQKYCFSTNHKLNLRRIVITNAALLKK